MADVLDIKSIDAAVQQMAADPNRLNTIAQSVKDNPKMFADLLAQTDKDPSMRGKLMSSVMDNPKLKQEAMTMSNEQKKQMTANMKLARMDMKEAMIDCVRICQNGVLKKYKLGGMFPKGTIFEDGDCYNIDPDLCVFTTKASTRKNRDASLIVGIDVFGELIVVKQCPNTNKYLPFTIDQAAIMKKEALARRASATQ